MPKSAFPLRMHAMKRLITISIAMFAACAASAGPTKISNEDAAALFGSLNAVKAGLSSANVGAAAEDLWLLKALSEEYGSQQTALQIAQSRANASKDVAGAMEAAIAKFDAYRLAVVGPIDLVPLTPFTDQEIKDAGITPALLAPIAHYLYPAKTK